MLLVIKVVRWSSKCSSHSAMACVLFSRKKIRHQLMSRLIALSLVPGVISNSICAVVQYALEKLCVVFRVGPLFYLPDMKKQHF